MPIYEYECSSCGHKLEIIQKMTELPITECPACHQGGLQKLVSASAFQLKGTGWYATDFRDKGKKEVKTETKQENATTTGESKSEGSKIEASTDKSGTDTGTAK